MRTRLQKRKIGDYQNFQIFCQRQTLFFVVVRTGSQTDTFGKSTIFSSFAAVQVLVKRGLTIYRLLITMIRIGNYFLTLFHGRGGGGRELLIMAYTGRHRPKGVGILLVEVYERVGKSVIWVRERVQKG